MRVYDPFCDRQAQAYATAVAVAALPETVEQVWLVQGIDARASVRYAKDDLGACHFCRNDDPPARLGEFERVRQDVSGRLEDAAGVGADEAWASGRAHRQVDATIRRCVTKRLFDIVHDLARVHVGHVKREAPPLDANCLQKITGQSRHLRCGLLREPKHAALLIWGRRLGEQKLNNGVDHIEWIPQVVGNDGEYVRPSLRQLFSLHSCDTLVLATSLAGGQVVADPSTRERERLTSAGFHM